ncbi:MAG: TPR end-of-group domain-containing protein [Candidatus Brocadiales bacterium]
METKPNLYNLPPIVAPKYNFKINAPEFNMNNDEFLIWFLEGVLEKYPDYYDCLTHLGNVYTAKGMYEKGLNVDLKLVKLKPANNLVHYNLACSYSLLGNINAAINTLEKAIDLGYKEVEHLERDSDLVNIRLDIRYKELIEKLKAKCSRKDS